MVRQHSCWFELPEDTQHSSPRRITRQRPSILFFSAAAEAEARSRRFISVRLRFVTGYRTSHQALLQSCRSVFTILASDSLYIERHCPLSVLTRRSGQVVCQILTKQQVSDRSCKACRFALGGDAPHRNFRHLANTQDWISADYPFKETLSCMVGNGLLIIVAAALAASHWQPVESSAAALR